MLKIKDTRNGISRARKRAKFVYILIGVVVAIPLLFVMISLLSSADQIFGDAVETLLGNIFLSWDAIWFLVFAFAALLFTYGIIVAAPFGSRHHRQAKAETHEPIIAITAMGLLTLVYLLFSVIQIYQGKQSRCSDRNDRFMCFCFCLSVMSASKRCRNNNSICK